MVKYNLSWLKNNFIYFSWLSIIQTRAFTYRWILSSSYQLTSKTINSVMLKIFFFRLSRALSSFLWVFLISVNLYSLGVNQMSENRYPEKKKKEQVGECRWMAHLGLQTPNEEGWICLYFFLTFFEVNHTEKDKKNFTWQYFYTYHLRGTFWKMIEGLQFSSIFFLGYLSNLSSHMFSILIP